MSRFNSYCPALFFFYYHVQFFVTADISTLVIIHLFSENYRGPYSKVKSDYLINTEENLMISSLFAKYDDVQRSVRNVQHSHLTNTELVPYFRMQLTVYGVAGQITVHIQLFSGCYHIYHKVI